MPFVAMVKSKNSTNFERVNMEHIQNPKAELIDHEIKCQCCDSPMIIKGGLMVSYHFAHVAETTTCLYSTASTGESFRHRAAKIAIAEKLREQPSYEGVSLLYEYPIKEIGRIVDVAGIHADNSIEVHEAQLSRISTQDLQERTDDYMRAGVEMVIWWLGHNARTEQNIAWTKEKFGYVALLDIPDGVVEVMQ